MNTRIKIAAMVFGVCLSLGCVPVFASGGEFFPGVNYSVPKSPWAVAAGDLNGDGIPDLVTANAGSGPQSVNVLLGKGDGSFFPPVTYNGGWAAAWVALADFNHDGKVDVIVANRGHQKVSLLLGNGDGTLQAPLSYDAGPSPIELAVADFNGDGNPDVAVCNFKGVNPFDGGVSVLLGHGDGTFAPRTQYVAGRQPFSIAVADFNGDGIDDIVVSNVNDVTITALLGNGNGTFGGPVRSFVGNEPEYLAAADFNRDGKADVTIAVNGRVGVTLSNGDGTFLNKQSYRINGGGGGIAVGDLNQDGFVDIANLQSGAAGVTVLLGQGDGTFVRNGTYFTDSAGQVDIIAADLNGDGYPDLVTTGPLNNIISVLLNVGP